MPTIYDNIDTDLLRGLRDALTATGARRADICVGYFNLRGWRCIADTIDALPGGADGADAAACRLIVGMTRDAEHAVRAHYNDADEETTQRQVVDAKKRFAASLAKQLTWGMPTAADEAGLRKLAAQLRGGKLTVKFFGAHPLHAKLYLAHRDDKMNPRSGFVGSSNLTLAGMKQQGELSVDVLEKDAAAKLAKWFEDRWLDNWCLDITDELAEIIERSWAGGPVAPYLVYVKTAYELSREAIEGARQFKVPAVFDKVMLEFQKLAVSLAAERLNRHRGVIIGDVVGLGKTLVASAVAKTFQEDRGDNVLVICPPKLELMWREHLHRYRIAGETLSLGKASQLRDMRRYRLVVIDESHNLRNRDSQRYAQIRDYLRDNESRVVLLTATPYNKAFTDIGNQLRLFLEADADIGIRPEAYIRFLGHAGHFKARHPTALITSLAAFEHSEEVDDWRELMRMYMVRRTRSHIKNNHAEYDSDRGQHYLTFDDDSRFYFPHRRAKCARFALDSRDQRDQYARLYSPQVVDIINALALPRYGIGQYLRPAAGDLSAAERVVIANLSRAGARLIGFARTGLFKRLESCGPAFLRSIERHITRNAVYLSALRRQLEFPTGDIFRALADEAVEEQEDEMFAALPGSAGAPGHGDLQRFLDAGDNIYEALAAPAHREKFQWIRSALFTESLADDLMQDCRELLKILNTTPRWDAAADRKVEALADLCMRVHRAEKLLVFTQFKDTADYLYEQLRARGVTAIGKAFGGMDDLSDCAARFSPASNNRAPGIVDELRVLISTDTLSEGQNLQDARIVVNFDLPWAIIRLVQRAGRVDRIGQQAREILCYCFLPADGIENIINLRRRLQQRIQQSAELIGSDEIFFEGDAVDLKQVYEETINLDGDEDETDLISRAYDIWRQAVKNDPGLEATIRGLPDVVYAAKRAAERGDHGDSRDAGRGVIAYIKTQHHQHLLARMNNAGEVASMSQSKMLAQLACAPDEPGAQPAANHHDLVAAAVRHVKQGHADLGGQLGGQNSVRCRVYNKMKFHLQTLSDSVFDSQALRKAVDLIYNHPLKEVARDRLGRQMRADIDDQELANMVMRLAAEDELCARPAAGEPDEPRIICSMGLVE